MIERSQAGGTGRLLFIINLQFKQQATATANYARREAAKVDCTWSGNRGDWEWDWDLYCILGVKSDKFSHNTAYSTRIFKD